MVQTLQEIPRKLGMTRAYEQVLDSQQVDRKGRAVIFEPNSKPVPPETRLMDVLEAISSRRSVFKFKTDPVPSDVIERILSYGCWAQNHHLTEPWRFVVVGEETKEILAKRYAEIQKAKAAEGADEETKQKLADAGYQKFHSKPTIVAVSCVQDGDEVKNREDYAATCCAMQNIALAAWAEGVGMQWTTGPVTLEESTYALLGMDKDREYIVGFMYTGYPDEVLVGRRKEVGEVLRYTD